jgi:hypothetical protein
MAQLVNLPAPQYLRTLTLDSVKLTEAEVRPIYQFSGLVSLQLVVVRGRAFQNLSRLTSLRSLTTWNCEWVNSDVLMQIGCLERLEHLTLNCCDQISDEGLRHLSTLTNLMSLGLTDLTVISEVGLRHLSTLTNLETLTLAYNPVTDEMVQVIAEHHTEKLQVLDLDASSLGEGRITDNGLIALGKLTKLRRLKLGYHSFTAAGLASLGNLTHLESLSLESVEGCVTGDSLASLSKLVHLRKLNFDSCSTFDDNAMARLVQFTELEHLNIAKTMIKRGLSYLSSDTHPRLTYLDISFSEKLDDAGLKYITRLQNLTTLHLFRCPKGHLTTKGTRDLLALKRLELLDCRECPISKDVARVLRTRIKDFRQDLALTSINLHNNLEEGNVVESEELPDSEDEVAPKMQNRNASVGQSTSTTASHTVNIVPVPPHLIRPPPSPQRFSITQKDQTKATGIQPIPFGDLSGFGASSYRSTRAYPVGMMTDEGLGVKDPNFPESDPRALQLTPEVNSGTNNGRLQDDMANYQLDSKLTDDSDFESEEFEELGDITDDEDDDYDDPRARRRPSAMQVDEEEGHQEADDRNLLAAILSQRSRPINSQTLTPMIGAQSNLSIILEGQSAFDVEELDD